MMRKIAPKQLVNQRIMLNKAKLPNKEGASTLKTNQTVSFCHIFFVPTHETIQA